VLLSTLPIVLLGCKPPKVAIPKDLLPTVVFDELKIKSIDFQGVDTSFVFKVDNPYPVGLHLSELNWDLALSGHSFLDGSKGKPIDIDANASSKVRFGVSTTYAEVFELVADAGGQDNLPYAVSGDIVIDSAVGPLTLPFAHEGDFPALHTPKLKLQALRVDNLSLTTASLALDMNLSSDQESAIGFDKLAYDISLGGKSAVSGDAKPPAVDGSGDFTLPIDIKLLSLAGTVVEALTSGGKLEVGATLDSTISTPFGGIPFTLDAEELLKVQ